MSGRMRLFESYAYADGADGAEHTPRNCDSLMTSIDRAVYPPALLDKALYLPWSGVFHRDDDIQRLETLDFLRACDTVGNMFLPVGSIAVDNARKLTPDEEEILVETSLLKQLAEEIRLKHPTSQQRDYVADILDDVVDLAETYGIEEILLVDVRTFSAAAAMGCFEPRHAFPPETLDEICVLCKNALFASGDIFAGEQTLEARISTLYLMAKNFVFTGFSCISDASETLRIHGKNTDPVDRLFESALARARSEIRVLFERLLFDVSTENAQKMSLNIPGLSTLLLFVRSSDKTPFDAEFWLPDDFFAPELNGIFDNGFPACGEAEKLLTFEWEVPPSPSNPRTALFAERFVVEELLPSEAWERARNLSDALVGYMDTATLARSRSAWRRHSAPLEARVASPLETEGFLERFDELAESTMFGFFLRDAFVLDCMDAFSATPSGADMFHFSDTPTFSNTVPSDEFERWLAERIPSALEKAVPFDVRIPILPGAMNAFGSDGVPLVLSIAEKSGMCTLGDAMAFFAVLKDKRTVESLGEYIGANYSHGIERIGAVVASALEKTKKTELSEEDGCAVRKLASIAVSSLSSGLRERPGTGKALSESIRKNLALLGLPEETLPETTPPM